MHHTKDQKIKNILYQLGFQDLPRILRTKAPNWNRKRKMMFAEVRITLGGGRLEENMGKKRLRMALMINLRGWEEEK